MEQKPETAENWIDYFLNKENNTPIDMPEGDMTQWQNWWDNLKTGDVQMPPHTTLSAITEAPTHSEPIKPITEMKVPMELTKKSRKKFVMPPEMAEKKVKEPTTGGLLW